MPPYRHQAYAEGERCFTAKCALERRNTPPGPHAAGRKRRAKVTELGQQLMEKQKAKYTYGTLERQFHRFFDEASRMQGITGDNLLVFLSEGWITWYSAWDLPIPAARPGK